MQIQFKKINKTTNQTRFVRTPLFTYRNMNDNNQPSQDEEIQQRVQNMFNNLNREQINEMQQENHELEIELNRAINILENFQDDSDNSDFEDLESDFLMEADYLSAKFLGDIASRNQ